MNEVAVADFNEQAPAHLVPSASRTAIGRRTGISVLVISPFSPLPQDAGQRKRVHQMLSVLKNLNLTLTLLLYPFEGEWAWRHQEDVVAQLRAEYDEVIVVPAAKNVGMPPRDGRLHALDEWWDELLGSYLQRLFESRHFDILLVNNVWLSKALTLVPPCVVRVIDMHDLFHLREMAYATAGVIPEFFRISEKDELFGLNRADACIAISLSEAKKLAETLQSSKVIYLPYASPAAPSKSSHQRHYLHPGKVVFGFVGSAHTFNVSGVSALLEELHRLISQNFAPIELIIAGDICDKLDSYAERIRMTRLGRIDDEDQFYDSIDFYIVPVFHGSGFKIKVADVLERGKPALFSEHAASGLAVDRALVADSPATLARAMSNIAFSRPPLGIYQGMINKSSQILTGQIDFGIGSLTSCLNECLIECIIDLRSLQGLRQWLALVSAIVTARELKDYARVRIIADVGEPWINAAARYLPPSVTFDNAATNWLPGRAGNRVWWRFGPDDAAAEPFRKSIVDLRFADRFTAANLPAEIVISPNQVGRLHDTANISWSCLPYLTESICWDPAARLVLAGCEKFAGEAWPGKHQNEQAIVIVDTDRDLNSTMAAIHGLGLVATVIDLRNDAKVASLIGKFHRMQGRDHQLRLVDGCVGASPLQWLALEMALLCGIPVATTAFGALQQIGPEELADWRARKVREDRFAFRSVIGQLDAMRGGLQRLQ